MINIIGSIQDSSGYSIHTMNLAQALSKLTDVRLTTQISPGFELTISDKMLELVKAKPKKEEINLIITLPIYWKLNLSNKRNWVYLVWEGDRIPKSFVKECSNEDIEYIIVPSKHTRDAIMNTIETNEEFMNMELEMEEKIKVINHGVNLDLFYPKNPHNQEVKAVHQGGSSGDSSKESANLSGDTIFLANKGFRNLEDRGGMQYLIKAYLEEFTEKDNVELIIKINPAYGIPDMKKVITELKIQNKQIPKMTVDTNLYKYEDLVKLYHKGNVFVSPSRAEAFGIPNIEAMACGLPVITTNFGGQTDFCNDQNSWIIGGELTEIKHELMYEGISWLTPDIDQLRKAMREAHTKPELVQKKGIQSLETAKRMTWDSCAEKITKLI